MRRLTKLKNLELKTYLRLHRHKINLGLLVVGVYVLFCFLAVGFTWSQRAGKQLELNRTKLITDNLITLDSVTTQVVANRSGPYRVCFGGDNNPGTLDKRILAGENIYAGVSQYLHANCDFTITNLETALASAGVGTPAQKNYTFMAPPQAIDQMIAANMHMVSMANNHSLDFGPAALLDGLGLMDAAGFGYFGAGANVTEAFKPKYLVTPQGKLGFVGGNAHEISVTRATNTRAGNATFDYPDRLLGAVKEANQNSDITIVFLHWGFENNTSISSIQRDWARKFIQAGADLVVGAGPHVPQGSEIMNGVPVYYSLGNFAVAGQWGVVAQRNSKLLNVAIENGKITNHFLTNIFIDEPGLPHIVVETQ